MRETRDPYRTWVAEVILQQTRMDQGLPYLRTFLEAFPDVLSLAAADEDKVLRLWQGLGYYSRARNLHASARHVNEQLGGIMPDTYKGLLELKGVGVYTAAAIASWCYGEACVAVDGNVSRVIARLYGIEEAINTPAGEKQVYALAGELLDPSNPGLHNQAMIEFGALQCVPVSPSCDTCPLAEHCEAYRQQRVEFFPLKIRNKKPVDRWFYYFMIRSGGECILVQRGQGDIWTGLYEFPLIESSAPQMEEEIIKMLPRILEPSGVAIHTLSPPLKHQLTHQTIHARFLQVELPRLPHPLPENWQPVLLQELDQYALPRLIHRYLESVKI